MNDIRAFASATAALLLAACAPATTGPEVGERAASVLDGPVEVTLALGETAAPGDGGVRVTFEEVVEDSRCPSDVTCFWEGNAAVELSLEVEGGVAHSGRINSTLDPRSFARDGVRVTYRHLDPLPRSEGTVPPGSYRLTVRLEPAR